MNDALGEAAGVLVPFAAAGSGAVAAGMAQAAGEELYRKATAILERIRGRFTGRPDPVQGLRVALKEALEAGDLEAVEITELLALSRRAQAVKQVGSVSVHGGVSSGDGGITLVGNNNVGELRGGTGRR
jgi:hypothetical protein